VASAQTTALAQAADLFGPGELDVLLDAGTVRETAEEALRRLLSAGRRPWWPMHCTDGAWAVLAGMDVVLLRAAIPELGRYYDGPRAIVLREDLPRDQEQAVLWHESLHAQRRDTGTISDEEHSELDRRAQQLAAAVSCA
jgi:hypothetical protein